MNISKGKLLSILIYCLLNSSMDFPYTDRSMQKLLYMMRNKLDESISLYNPSVQLLNEACMTYMRLKGMYYTCTPIFARIALDDIPDYEYMRILAIDIDNCRKTLNKDIQKMASHNKQN